MAWREREASAGVHPAAQHTGKQHESNKQADSLTCTSELRVPLQTPLISVDSELFLKEEKRGSVQTSALILELSEKYGGY